MLEELRWRTSVSATCLHAAACRAAGLPAADSTLDDAVGPAADALVSEITGAGWPVPAMLDQLTALAGNIDNNREMVTRAATRLHLPVGEMESPVRVAGAISDLEAAINRAQPALAEELAARVRPIREQWEARGPGMLQEIARLTDASVVPPAAEIVLVAPYVGGHGGAHAAYNRVTFEAVLFNPHPELPEVVRLAWLLSQLNSELPRFADALPAGRAAESFRLAMIPPVLAGAEAVELARCDEQAIAMALAAWRVRDARAEQLAKQMWAWWNAWLEGQAKWPVANAALERMLG